MKAIHLTVEGIARTKLPLKGMKWLADTDGGRGTGRLYARVSASGARDFYFRYTTSKGERVAKPLGVFARTPELGKLTLAQAREEVGRLREKLKSDPDRDLRAVEKRETQAREEAEAARLALEAERVKKTEAKERYTVAALADAYSRHLRRLGKPSARDVESIFKNHLHKTEWATRMAAELSAKEVATLLRRVVDAGHGRTAAKFRSYLHAAYALALNAELDPSISSDFLPFSVQVNPVASTGSLSQYNNAREHTLTEDELRIYWQRVNEIRSDPVRAALKLALLLGGQRVAQLLRLRLVDVDLQAGKVRLYDGKGRRKNPRIHELPLTEEAIAILQLMIRRSESLGCNWIFTSNGSVPISPDTMGETISNIAEEMTRDGKCRFLFKPSDIRRTVETLLASKGISRDIRAQIQSHGLSGVQVRHYDKHDYQNEKRQVLEFLAALLSGKHSKKIVQLHSQVA